jgi:intracellular sulfur oxidation DsrE/DsrF family protein
LNNYRNRVNKLINAIASHAKDATKERASVVMRTSHIECLPDEARSSLISA